MFSFYVSRAGVLRAMAAVLLCFALTGIAAAKAPNVTFTAAGTFATPPVSGADTLKLAGEPFTISIVANTASVPTEHGPNWAVFSPLKMTGTVHSGLLGSTPVNIASDAASIELAVGPSYDVFTAGFPVKVVGISLTIVAKLTLPAGTLPNQLVHPFAAVTLSPATSTVTYSDTTNSTTLTVQSGTVAGTLPAGAVVQTGVRMGGTEPVQDAANRSVLVPRRWLREI